MRREPLSGTRKYFFPIWETTIQPADGFGVGVVSVRPVSGQPDPLTRLELSLGFLGMPSFRRQRRRGAGFAALAAAAVTLALAPGAAATPAAASTPGRVALPDPTPVSTLAGTPATLASAPTLKLRVYLAGQPGLASAALAVSNPRSPRYGHYLTAAQFRRRYGATAAQASTVANWLAAQGMQVTATNRHYIAVKATTAEVDAAFGTTLIQYDFPPITIDGRQFPSEPQLGTSGGFSVPAALGGDIAAVTGFGMVVLPVPPPSSSASAPASAAKASAAKPATTAADGYQCSQYWGQHTERIPQAYGRTTAPTQLCGYTPNQVRKAYGVSSSPDKGKGVTVAVVMTDSSPTMLSDANRYFASHGLAGFTPGQFTVNEPASVAASCSDDDASDGGISAGTKITQDEPGGFDVNTLEEAIDVESVHVTAPDAKVVYTAAGCNDNSAEQQMQELLDAETRVADQHLANVVTGSFDDDEGQYSPSDGAAWDLTFEQGALEGIGFDLSSGDGGANISPPLQTTAMVGFPGSSPWATTVGGTSLAIGRNGTPVADYPWGDDGTEVDTAGTGYTSPPPGQFVDGSTGGVSELFAEPAYQKPVVPAALATDNGTTTSRRVVPDISANAGSQMLIGYTGAVTSGVYAQTAEGGGTSLAAPLFAGLEADTIQAAGHPLGFLNPALYLLHGTAAISDVAPVNPAHPPVLIGTQLNLGSGDDYLTTLGEDQAPLKATRGYDDETGLGTPGPSFVTAFGH
jgi:subtilase family serine protease